MTNRLIYELHGLRILSWCPYKDDQHIQAMSTSTCNYLRFLKRLYHKYACSCHKYACNILHVTQLAL